MLATTSDHMRGTGELELVEYGDFECPDCLQAFPHVESWQKELQGKITFVFRHMPLDQLYPIHPNATIAAQAAEAAALQGKFWEAHKLLFENQESLSDEFCASIASMLGINEQQFHEDLESEEVTEKVKQSVAEGQSRGVTSTPTFFINGEKVEESRNYSQVLELLKAKTQA